METTIPKTRSIPRMSTVEVHTGIEIMLRMTRSLTKSGAMRRTGYHFMDGGGVQLMATCMNSANQ